MPEANMYLIWKSSMTKLNHVCNFYVTLDAANAQIKCKYT